jgi:hypothetical protein
VHLVAPTVRQDTIQIAAGETNSPAANFHPFSPGIESARQTAALKNFSVTALAHFMRIVYTISYHIRIN